MKLLRRALLSIIVFFVLCYSLVWLLSPWLVRTFAAESLASQNIELDPNSQVRLNLFSSSLSVDNLRLRRSDSTTYELRHLELHYNLWRLFKKEVHIERVDLRGMTLQVVKHGEQLNVAGVDIGAQDGEVESEAPDVSVNEVDDNEEQGGLIDAFSFAAPEIVLSDVHINLINEGTAHSLLINMLEFQHTSYRNQTLGTTVNLNANLDGANVQLAANVVVEAGDAGLELDLNIEAFNPAAYQYLMPTEIKNLQAAVNIALKVDLALQAEQLTIASAALTFKIDDFLLQDKTFQADFSGFDLSVPEFSAQLNLDGTAVEAQATLNMDLSELQLGLADSPTILASLKHIVTSEIQLNLSDANYKIAGDKVALEGVVVSKVSEDLPALFAMEAINFNEMLFSPELISMKSINLGSGQANISIDKNGTMLTLLDTSKLGGSAEGEGSEGENVQNTVSSEQPEAPSSADGDDSAPRILLGQLSLAAPFNVAISDQSNSNAFEKNFVLTDLQVGEVDSAQVDKQTDFLLKLKDQEYFKGAVTGWVKPFTKKLNLQAEAKIQEFSLHEVAPYLKDSLGFEVTAGQLDLDFKGDVTDDEVKSKSVILMRGAQFGASEKLDEANLIGQSAIPLNVALGMLKDADGNIELKVPVDGNVNSPDFGLHYIVGLVVKKVAMSQAKKQLMNMFVPYAQVVTIAISAGSYALKVRFEDLSYAPGQVDVEAAQAEFVQQITALMNDKKDIQVRVCPVAVVGDLPEPAAVPVSSEQHAQLLDIAQKRAQLFKAKIVSGGVESSRLLLCSPSVDKSKAAVPRLEFGT